MSLTLRIVLIGAKGVGKSQITFELTGQASDKIKYRLKYQEDKHIFELSITCINSIAYQEDLIRKADGFALVFDLTSKKSLASLKEDIRYLEQIRGRVFPVVLIGNKCDLQKQRGITDGEITAFRHYTSCSYFESSAMLGYKIQEAFAGLIVDILRYKKALQQHLQSQPAANPIVQAHKMVTGLFTSSTLEHSDDMNELIKTIKKP